MAQLPRMFINIQDIQQMLFELQDENLRLKEQLKQYEKLLQDITNISNGGNIGIEKETYKVSEGQEKL